MPNIGVCEMLQLIFLYKNVHNTHTYNKNGKNEYCFIWSVGMHVLYWIHFMLFSYLFPIRSKTKKNEETFLAYRFHCNIPLDNMFFFSWIPFRHTVFVTVKPSPLQIVILCCVSFWNNKKPNTKNEKQKIAFADFR